MSLKKRRIIFWIFAFVFVIGAVYVVLHSSGWRLNTKTFVFEKTGGIYIKSQPQDVLITIDRKSQKSKTGLIFYKGTLFTNLRHKTYNIEVKKEDFLTWSKRLNVEPLLVTQATHIILLPKNPQVSEVFSFPKNCEQIFYSPSYDNLLAKFSFEKEISLFVFGAKNNSFKMIYQATEEEWKKFAGSIGENLQVKWSPNEKMFILADYAFSVGGENANPVNIRKEFYGLLSKKIGAKKSGAVKIEEIFWHPFLENTFLIETSHPFQFFDSGKAILATSTEEKLTASARNGGTLHLLNLDKRELSKLLDLTESKNSATNGSGIYWIDSLNRLFHFNLISKSSSLLYAAAAPTSFAPQLISEPDLTVSGNHDFIAVISRDSGALHILDVSRKEFYKPMHSGVKKIIFSPDNKKLAVLENDFLKIIYLTDFYDDFIKKKGDIDLLGQYPDISDFFWHFNSNYLWIKTAEKLQIVEIDTRDKINSMDLQNIDLNADVFLKDNVIYSADKNGVRQYKIFE